MELLRSGSVRPWLRCGQCTGIPSPFGHRDAAAILRSSADRWSDALATGLPGWRGTGAPAWSTLEHACHVRDMCLLFPVRLAAILGTDWTPPARRGTESELLSRYRDENPHEVAYELTSAARDLSDRLERLTPAEWLRPDPRGGSTGMTVRFFTGHLVHDIIHNLAVATRG